MSYRDTLITCTNCGKEFVFRVEEQRRLAKRGEEIEPPDLCPDCQSPSHTQHRPEPRPTPEAAALPGSGPQEGSVKWYDTEKGYGFIVHAGGEEIFFHRTGIAPDESPVFPDGTRVTFLVEETEKGPQAVDVARMDTEDDV
jgi:CspA family cold shock protein